MQALGFGWRQQIAAAAEGGRRRLTVGEMFGLAYVLETSIEALLDPGPDDKQIQMPGGGSVPRGSVLRSVRGSNDGAVTWLSDDRPDFGSGTWPWPAGDAGPELASDLLLEPFRELFPPPLWEKFIEFLRQSPVIGPVPSTPERLARAESHDDHGT